MQRQEVYHVIDGEREYQDRLITDQNWNNPKTVGEFLTLLDCYVVKAKADWLTESDSGEDRPSLAQVRKIAAIAVACLEAHGAPARVIPPKEDYEPSHVVLEDGKYNLVKLAPDDGTIRIQAWSDGLPNIKP